MAEFRDLVQTADWKKEKHVPVIDAPEKVKKGEMFKLSVAVGKEVAHPNTTNHHIRWISVYFMPDSAKFPIQIGRFEFSSHGESAEGADLSTVYTGADVTCSFKTDKSGAVLVTSYCNIHGLWQSAKRISVA